MHRGGLKGMQRRATQMKSSNSLKKGEKLNLRRLAEVLRDEDFDLPAELVRVLRGGDLDDDVKARLMLSMLEYVEPKLKSVEVTQDKPFEAVIRWAE
jgi:hypothetical protein